MARLAFEGAVRTAAFRGHQHDVLQVVCCGPAARHISPTSGINDEASGVSCQCSFSISSMNYIIETE